MIKYLFLDCDGVLNDERVQHANGVHGVDPLCVDRLNTIINATDPKIVISSSWRKDIHRGHMTLAGLEKMLMRLGVNCRYRLVGITDPDDHATSRGKLISAWLSNHVTDWYRYCILDDGSYWLRNQPDHGIRDAGHGANFVQTDFRTGLTDQDVIKAIGILNNKKTAQPLARSYA